MGLQLENVVPWGRSLAEYTAMFALSEGDRSSKILDCAGGPASFNAEMTRKGYSVTSCDPVYQFSSSDIEKRIHDTYDAIVEGVRANQDQYVWTQIRSPEALGQIRMEAMRSFLADFEPGKQAGRYITAALPQLPFSAHQFDLALCGHFLFTYSDHFSLDFHLASIAELCRVAAEVRIFPILNLGGEASPWLEPVLQQLAAQGYHTQILPVAYEFQKGGDRLLKIQPQA